MPIDTLKPHQKIMHDKSRTSGPQIRNDIGVLFDELMATREELARAKQYLHKFTISQTHWNDPWGQVQYNLDPYFEKERPVQSKMVFDAIKATQIEKIEEAIPDLVSRMNRPKDFFNIWHEARLVWEAMTSDDIGYARFCIRTPDLMRATRIKSPRTLTKPTKWLEDYGLIKIGGGRGGSGEGFRFKWFGLADHLAFSGDIELRVKAYFDIFDHPFWEKLYLSVEGSGPQVLSVVTGEDRERLKRLWK